MNSSVSKLIVGSCLTALLAGCSGSSGAISGGSTSGVGIFGVVSTSNVSSLMSQKPKGRFEVQARQDIVEQTINGCTVVAKELGGADTTVATATSNSSGEYDLTGLDASKSYRISTDCGGTNQFSSVGKPAADDSTRIVTNPRSTLIAAMIVQSVATAIDSAVNGHGFSAEVQALIKASLKTALDSLVTSVAALITEQIESGAIPDPSPSDATAMTASTITVANTKTPDEMTTAINTGYTSGTIPPSVTESVASAAKSTAALPDCDSSLSTASLQKCTIALAKVMNNVLGFTVALKETTLDVAFGTATFVSGDCSTAKTELVETFPKAKFQDHNDEPNLPEGICVIAPSSPRPNRNKNFDPMGGGGGGDHGGPIFIETVTISGTSQVGLLSALATGMFTDYKHTLADIDKMLYGRTGTGATRAGMDSRLVAEAYSSGSRSFYYVNSSGSWVNSSWPANCSGSPCVPSDHGGDSGLSVHLSAIDWSATAPVSGDHTSVVAPLMATTQYRTAVLAMTPSLKQFGTGTGNLPTVPELKNFLDEDKIHSDYNPYGPSELYVMYGMAPYRGAGTISGDNKGCWDQDAATVCYGSDHTTGTTGTPYPAIKATFLTGSATTVSGAEYGFRPITRITAGMVSNDNTNYFVIPVYKYSNGPGVWAGVFKFIKTSDGRAYKDEVGRERAIYVITDASQCNTQLDGSGLTIPTAGSGLSGAGSCEVGNAFNASLDYSNCNGMGASCPAIHITNTTPILASVGVKLDINIRSQLKTNWLNYGNPNHGGHQVLALQTMQGQQPIRITVVSGDNTFADGTPATFGFGTLAANEYYVGVRFSCSGTGADSFCGPDATGFYLIDGSGAVVQDAASITKWDDGAAGPITLCSVGNPFPVCTSSVNYAKIPIADFTGATFDFDGQSGTESFNSVFKFFDLDQGPVPNPVWKCSGSPYFVRTSESSTNYEITGACNANDTADATGAKTFSGKWDYYSWVNDPAGALETPTRSTRKLIENGKNAFAYSDPEAAKALISTAFTGMMDGKHQLVASTQLTSLQAFALVYMTLSKDGNLQHFDGTPVVSGGTGGFYRLSPMNYLSDSADQVREINTVFANGILNFKQ